MRSLILIFALASLATVPATAGAAEGGDCPKVSPSDSPDVVPGSYPEHPLSPMESLKTFDTVILAEVILPSRPCSLGWCAGLHVIRRLKGQASGNVIIQVATHSDRLPCGPENYRVKGQRWIVFANRGTSPGGQSFLAADLGGPSFQSSDLPDFARLEAHYRAKRAQLDQLIEERLGHSTTGL